MPLDGSLYRQPQREPWQQLLLDAADLLERDGWCRGEFVSGRRHCALGALGSAWMKRNGVRETHQLHSSLAITFWAGSRATDYELAAAVLGHQVGTVNVGGWNNQPGRKAEQVIAAMREAASLPLPSFSDAKVTLSLPV